MVNLKMRSEPSVEYRMRNVSAVMQAHGQPTISGYLPAQNAGDTVRTKLWAIIKEERARGTKMPPLGMKMRGKPARRPPMIYFNIGWMKRYHGMTAGDPTLGGHRFLDTHDHGAESFNFLETPDGRVEGYRPPGGAKCVNIGRLGAAPSDKSIDGILVVWLAREPISGRTMVVGWYENATVYASAREEGAHAAAGGVWGYSVEAKVSDAHLVPEIARTYWVRSARTALDGGFGQNTTWYGVERVNERVWNYVQSVLGERPTSPAKAAAKKPPINIDPELRRKVEKAAVDHAQDYYRSRDGGSCFVKSVEPLGKGWDLEVTSSTAEWLVEVKGLQGSSLVCELTPNEYAQMRKRAHRKRYVVYVVTNALSAPMAALFHYSGGAWRTADGRELLIEERMGAVLRCG